MLFVLVYRLFIVKGMQKVSSLIHLKLIGNYRLKPLINQSEELVVWLCSLKSSCDVI